MSVIKVNLKLKIECGNENATYSLSMHRTEQEEILCMSLFESS